MSPSRTRKPVASLGRPRSEIYVAIAVSAGIVLATLLLIWLMRPGNARAGTGGLFNRQPRVTLFVIVVVAIVALGIWWVRRGRHRPRRMNQRVATIGVIVIIAIGAIVAGILWPGGLIKHYAPVPKVTPETTPTTVPAVTPTTVAPNSTAPPTTKKP